MAARATSRPSVNYVEKVYLYNVDDLQTIANDYLKSRQDEIGRREQIIAAKVAVLLVPQRGGRHKMEGQ